MTTDDFFKQFRKGKLEAFYETVYPGLVVWAERILGQELAFLAEDCVQESVFETYNKVGELKSGTHWRLFLYTCVRNRAISLRRRQLIHQGYADLNQTPLHTDSVEATIIEHEVVEELKQVLDTLSPQDRELFYCSYELGMRNADIAERLSLAEITIKKRKARLAATLRQRLKGLISDRHLAIILFALLHSGHGSL